MPEDILKIVLAIVIGGVIGFEREYRDKAAGFRTLIFICLASTTFTILSVKLAGTFDPTRIAANIVAGVGFFGAGVIIRDHGRVVGLTTAAMIWLIAALGMGIGGGYYQLVFLMTGVSLLVLWGFPWFEHLIDRIREERTYEVVFAVDQGKYFAIEQLFKESGLRLIRQQQSKRGTHLTCSWHAIGAPERHDRLVAKLMSDPAILEMRF